MCTEIKSGFKAFFQTTIKISKLKGVKFIRPEIKQTFVRKAFGVYYEPTFSMHSLNTG